MSRKQKPTVLMGGEKLRTIHHLTAKERHDAYCYPNEEFAQECTMEEMIDFSIPFVVKACGITKEEAQKQMMEYFPQLKRWKLADK